MKSEIPAEPLPTLMELQKISLYYGSTQALKSIDLTIRKGEIHAIIGEHGAGKSSLARILGGYTKPKSGIVLWKGKRHVSGGNHPEKRPGTELVMQDIQQYEQLTIAQNLFGNDPLFYKKPFFSHKNLINRGNTIFESLGLKFNAAGLLSDLNETDKVLLELVKHLIPSPELLILDETFEKMTAVDLNNMIPELKKRKEQGMSIVFITHRIDDVYTFADRVTVIRKGRTLATESVKNINKINLIKLAYTQVIQESSLDTTTREFYQLLKYNRAILEHLPVKLLVVDEEQIVRLINNNAKDFFKLADIPVISRPVHELFQLHGNEEAYETIIRSLKEKKYESFHLRLIKPDKEISINIITTYPIMDESLCIGSMIIINDITEQEQLKEKLIFSEKLGSVGLLAAGVSHEINNPLEIIINEVEYLRRNTEDKFLSVLNNIEEEIESIVQIVSNLAAFSDSSSPKEEILDISTIVSRIVKLVSHNAIQKEITLEYTPRSSPLTVKGNRTEIKQIILNIIKNSFEAIHKKGKLEISLSSLKIEEVPYVQMIFRDTGPGISESVRKDIFLPFFTNKGSSGKNMGLGLSVSYGIINKMNGRITVENHSEGGCLFTIQLPCHDV